MAVIGGMNVLTGQSTADDEELAAGMATAAQLTDQVRQLVRDIYEEATNQLTSKVSAKITARGLETPLGILDLEQIAEGEAILGRIQDHLTSTVGFLDQGSVAKLSGEVCLQHTTALMAFQECDVVADCNVASPVLHSDSASAGALESRDGRGDHRHDREARGEAGAAPAHEGRAQGTASGLGLCSSRGYHAHSTPPLLLTQLAQVMSHVRSGREFGGAYLRAEEDLEVQIKYKALNCAISHVSHGSPEFKGIKKMISTAAHPFCRLSHRHHHIIH
jgi:hypothetical protein